MFPSVRYLLLQTGDRARLVLAVTEATPVRVDPTNAVLEIGPVAITPRGSATVETLLLVQVPAGDRARLVAQARELATSRMAPALRDTARSWAAVSSISTRDRTVQEIFDKARIGLAAMIGPDGTMDVGIFEYGAQWVRDTSNTALGALHAGQFETARNVLQHILTKMVTQDGVTMIVESFDKPDLEQFDQAG